MSMVRVVCCPYSVREDWRERLSEIWPVLKSTEDKYPSLEDKFIEVDELPEWLGECNAISIKPIKKVRFIAPDFPDLKNFKNPEIREFIKTVNQIVMPGFELLKYGAIQVLTDECTDSIQSELDEGWRIIAVLPQHGQRRPDYILVREQK